MSIEFRPHPYQRTAIDWICGKPRCCLFLDMGLGKTVSTLTAAARLIDRCDVERVLIVAPKKVAETTWGAELAKWRHLRGYSITPLIGSPAQRRKALHSRSDFYVIGRDSLPWLAAEVCQKDAPRFDMLVFDELSSFKSHRAARFKAARRLSALADRVVGLTGTPAPNGLIDLWAQLYCVDLGERLGRSITRYRSTYFTAQMMGHIPIRHHIKPDAQRIIEQKISDICLSMKAVDFLTLPPVQYVDEWVRLPEKILRAYQEFERAKVLELPETPIVAGEALALMNKLSQMANGAVYDDTGDSHIVHDEKLSRLEELIEAAASPVLVFYHFTQDADRIANRFPSLRVRRYEGEKDLQAWNAGHIDLLLAHPFSTAYGLNLQQGGHYIVWYGLGWNLEHYQQANARLHRQGQQHIVTVYHLLTASTVDERTRRALEGKAATQNALIEAVKALNQKHRQQCTTEHTETTTGR